MTNTLTIKTAITLRQELVPKVQSDLQEFKSGQIQREKIQSLIGQLKSLRETSDVIENSRTKLEGRAKVIGKVKWVTVGAVGLIMLGWILSSGGSILNFGLESEKEECKKTPVHGVTLAVELIGMLISVTVVPSIFVMDDDRDKWRVFSRMGNIEKMAEIFLEAFLEALVSFSSAPDSEGFKNCMQSLDKIPTGNLRSTLPSNERWIGLFIETLPEDHPLKKQILEIYRLTQEPDSGRTETKTASSLDSGYTVSEPFGGEQATHGSAIDGKQTSAYPDHVVKKNLLNERWALFEKDLKRTAELEDRVWTLDTVEFRGRRLINPGSSLCF